MLYVLYNTPNTGYLSLQDRLKSAQHVLDEEVKENEPLEALIWQQKTTLGRNKAKLAKRKNWAERIVIYSSSE